MNQDQQYDPHLKTNVLVKHSGHDAITLMAAIARNTGIEYAYSVPTWTSGVIVPFMRESEALEFQLLVALGAESGKWPWHETRRISESY